MTTILLSALSLAAVPSPTPAAQLVTLEQEPSRDQAFLPGDAVFFLPNSSALSPLALNIVAQAARQAQAASPGTIVVIQANHDSQDGETDKTALSRGDAVRDELIRRGVPNSAIRILVSDVSGTGIEGRSVVVSVIPSAVDSVIG